MSPTPPLPLEVDCRSVKQRIDSGSDVLLLDCREPQEFEIATIRGAMLLPMSQLVERAGELDPLRQRHIVVYCHLGGRSMRVAQWLRAQGFDRVQSMSGGIDEWAAEIDPSLPRY
jgi:adenylyltransferase/sulfurtransferase